LLGSRLYETMLVWETDPSMRYSEVDAAFADVWCAIGIGGAGLAAAAIELGLVDELRMSAIRSSSVAARRSCRRSPKRSHWT
jgi:hypothetical protein